MFLISLSKLENEEFFLDKFLISDDFTVEFKKFYEICFATLKININVLDFWWLYNYFLDGNYSGFITALLLLLIAIYCASRLRIVSIMRDH